MFFQRICLILRFNNIRKYQLGEGKYSVAAFWKVFINEVLDREGDTIRLLDKAGCEVILWRPMGEYPGYSEAEMICLAEEVDALMGASRDPYTNKVIAQSKRLQVISKYGGGVEKIDLEAANECGVLVCNTPIKEDVEAVAEHTITLMFALVKRLKKMEAHLREGGWRDFSIESQDLWGKTVGIIGMGRIGKAVAERLQNWGVRLLFYDPFGEMSSLKMRGIEKTTLDALLQESDIVSLHVVANPETYHLLDGQKLRMIKRTSYIVNTSRGEVIDEMALVKALEGSWIAGAGIDVFEKEPISSNHPLLSFGQVILTPHVAGWTSRSNRKITEKAVENCLSVLRGEIPSSLVNREALPQWRQRFGKDV